MGFVESSALLSSLAECHAPSGREEQRRDRISAVLAEVGCDVFVGRDGTLFARFHGSDPGEAPLLICAHMDEVGFMIKSHAEDGTMPIAPLGVEDPQLLAGRRVSVLTEDGEIPGFIGVRPVHLSRGKEKPTYSDLYADLGFRSADEAQAAVPKGSYGVYETAAEPLEGGYFKAKSLSSVAGCAAALLAVRLLAGSGNPPRRDVVFAFTCRGELSISGVTTALRRVRPAAVVVLSCAEVKCHPGDGRPMMGSGPVLCAAGASSAADVELKALLQAAAAECDIPLQPGVSPSDEAKRAARACPCAAISLDIPVTGPKSAASVVSVHDVTACGQLIFEAIEKGI